MKRHFYVLLTACSFTPFRRAAVLQTYFSPLSSCGPSLEFFSEQDHFHFLSNSADFLSFTTCHCTGWTRVPYPVCLRAARG
ncbi:unnamed protein product [Pylaiella littoralis]